MGERYVVVASPHGFCAGVRRAIEAIELTLEHAAGPVYCYHELVHNRRVVDGLRARGVRFVENVADVPEGATLLFSAHGVSPAVRAEAGARKLQVIDATCPVVMKVHREVRRYAATGYAVLLIGHRNHDEIVGVQGEAPGHVTVIQDAVEAGTVEVPDPERVAAVSQTTLSVEETKRVISILDRRFPGLATPHDGDICHATTNRQRAVKLLAGQAALVLVLGSPTSSNSRRLVEVAKEAGAEAHLIDATEALDAVDVESYDVVGLTAGASTPEPCIAEALAALATRGFAEVKHLEAVEEDVHFALPRNLRCSLDQSCHDE